MKIRVTTYRNEGKIFEHSTKVYWEVDDGNNLNIFNSHFKIFTYANGNWITAEWIDDTKKNPE
jgi:hypothetical protein